MARIIKSVSLSPKLNDIITNNIPDFSTYVQDCIEKDFLTQSKINEKIKKYEDKIKELKKLTFNTTKEDNNKEEEFIKDAKIRFKKDNSFLQGIFMQYKNIFGKNITIDKFRKLIE